MAACWGKICPNENQPHQPDSQEHRWEVESQRTKRSDSYRGTQGGSGAT